jgi:hypothetical protein
MKTKTEELDVDFIGGETSLTKAEAKALSNFFMQRKTLSTKLNVKQKRTQKKKIGFLEKI